MAQWPLSRLLRHASILLSGGAIGAGLAFLSSIVAARALGAADLGRIVLVQSLVYAVDRLVNFQSWRTVIKFGADARESGEPGAFAAVVKFGVFLDAGSALVGAALAAAATFPAAALLDWDRTTHTMALVYAAVIALNLAGTPTAVLRLADRYGVFVRQRVVAGSVKLVGVILAWKLGAGAPGVLAAWIVGDVVAWWTLVIAAWRELRRGEDRGFLSASLSGIRERHPGILGFAVVTNLTTSIRMASRQIDDFVIGAMLSEAAVGLYRVAKQFAMLIGVARDPLSHATYPDMAKQVATRDFGALRRSMRHALGIALALAVPYWLLFLLAGGRVLEWTVGAEFVPARGVLVWYTGAHAIGLIFFYLPSAVMALGRPQASLIATIAATVVYFALLVPAIRMFGLAGAGMAYVVFFGVWAASMLWSLRRAIASTA
jgi:O-antigen/teichoic acid export membrane protein